MVFFAARAGLNPIELLSLLRDAQFEQTLITMVRAMPQIAADIVQDAKSRLDCCPRCKGWGRITRREGEHREQKRCVQCDGPGVVRVPGDTTARKVVFEAVGMAQRGSAKGTAMGGIAKKTLQRASKVLEVHKDKSGMTGPWQWSLPPKVAKTAEDAQEGNLTTFEKDGHLRECQDEFGDLDMGPDYPD